MLRSLQVRIEDHNSTVVFKALLVVHALMQCNSSTAVFSYLAGDPSALRLKRVATLGLVEYTYSKLLKRYAQYLEFRIQAFKEIGYDVSYAGKRDQFARLRKLSVNKGLLREIALIQRVTKAILECTFFIEEPQDELIIYALEMIIKDLLSYYMGMNEGIINMLEHYFEMSRPNAERALELYKRFCFQTEQVLAFLNLTRRRCYQLRSSIPQLKHAPLELADALEEYLHNPDVDKNTKKNVQSKNESEIGGDKSAETEPRSHTEPTAPDASKKAEASAPNSSKKALDDFFEALETQPSNTPFNAAYSSFAGFSQPDWTGFGIGGQPTGFPFMQPQPAGFNPFSPQITVPSGAPAPLAPQHTMATTPFDSIFGQLSLGAPSLGPTTAGSLQQTEASQPSGPFVPSQHFGQPMPSPAQLPPVQSHTNHLSRQGSADLATTQHTSPRVKPQRTDTMNPFSLPSDFEEPPPEQPRPPRQPTLYELAVHGRSAFESPPSQEPKQSLQPMPTGIMGNVASEFARPNASITAETPSRAAEPTETHLSSLPMDQQLAKDPHSLPTSALSSSRSSTLATSIPSFAPQQSASGMPTGTSIGPLHEPSDQKTLSSQALTAQATGALGAQAFHRNPLTTQATGMRKPFVPQSQFGASVAADPSLASSLTSQESSAEHRLPSLDYIQSPNPHTSGLGISSSLAQGAGRSNLSNEGVSQTGGLGSQLTGLNSRSLSLGMQPTGLSSYSSIDSHPTGLGASSIRLGSQSTGISSQTALSSLRTGFPSQANHFSSLPTGAGPQDNVRLSYEKPGALPAGVGLPTDTTLGSGASVQTSSLDQNPKNNIIRFQDTGLPRRTALDAGPSVTGLNAPPSSLGNPSFIPDLSAQITGLTGIKPFQPSSSFGHSLLSSGVVPQPSQSEPSAQTHDLLQL